MPLTIRQIFFGGTSTARFDITQTKLNVLLNDKMFIKP